MQHSPALIWAFRVVAFVLLFLFLPSLNFATPVPCTAEDLWPLAQLDVQLAFVYRDDRIAGIRRGLDFYNQRSWQFPQWPAAWQPPRNQTWCDYGPGATTPAQYISSANVPFTGTSIPLTPSIQFVLDALLRYKLYEESSIGCTLSQRMACDDEARVCECSCPAGSPDDTSCATADASQNNLVTASIVLTSIALGIVVLAIIALLVGLVKALNTILELAYKLHTMLRSNNKTVSNTAAPISIQTTTTTPAPAAMAIAPTVIEKPATVRQRTKPLDATAAMMQQ